MSSFNLVKEKARYKHAPVAPLVRLTHGAHHGPNFNLISKREWVRKQTQSSNWTSKLKFAKFDECFWKSCGVWVTHKLLSFFVFKAISAQKLSTQNGDFIFASFKNGNLRVIFVHEVSLRSLTSLFDWGHLFVIYVASGKFCKSRKMRFCIFPEVSMMWGVVWCYWFVSNAFRYEEIASHTFAKFCDLYYQKIFLATA